jgi:hypothetical protein
MSSNFSAKFGARATLKRVIVEEKNQQKVT